MIAKKKNRKHDALELSDQLDAIAATLLFQSFQKEDLAKILAKQACSLHQFQKGEIIHRKDDPCRTVDLILKGNVGLQSTDPEGNVLAVHLLSRGEMNGAGLLFASDNRYPMMVIAESSVMLLRLPRATILSLCAQNSDFTHTLFREVSDRAVMLAERMHTFAYQSIRRRLSDYLRKECQSQKSRTILLPFSKKQIAEQFGIQPQSLSRVLNKMRKDGILDYKHRTIQLKEKFFN